MNRVVDTERLSMAERLQLVQDLWDEIAAEPERVPVRGAQRTELDRRLAEHATSPDDCRDWKDIKGSLGK